MIFSALLFTAIRAQAFPYATFVEENTTNGLEDSADIRFGDADNDGDLDIVTCGRIGAGTNRDLYILPGDGAGNFAAPVSIPPAGANNGVGMCALALGDMDSDGDLDVVVTGRGTGAANNNDFLRVYLRGAAAWTLTTVLGGGGNSVEAGGLALGDYDNDGDLDILSTGIHQTATTILTRIYQNNGAGTAYTAITPTGVTNIWNGGAAWGDFDADGWLDMLVSGATNAAGTTEQLRVYRSNAGASWTAIDLTPALTLSDVAWGDFNGDGLLDVVAMGSDGANEQIRWWQNNGAGGFGAAQLVAAANAGLSEGRLAVGDVDRDGDLDVVASGSANSATAAINVYTNSGAGVFTLNAIANGLWDGSVALADANGNGTLDMASVGLDTAANRRIRYYPSTSAANTAPNAPGGLSATFTYAVAPAMSTAAFQWNPSTDAGAGATAANLLHYDIQISTANNGFASGLYVFPSMDGASPRRGAYQRPPIVGGKHTVYLRSTSPLDAEPAPYGLQDNTTYYFRVRTIDAGLMESAWSATGSLFTGVPANAVTTLAVAAATTDGQLVLNWTSPGNIGLAPNPSYDVRWALTAITSDALFNAATPLTGEPTPGATGAAQTMLVRGVPPEQTVFFALKTLNAGGTSAVSNSPSGTPLAFDRTQIDVGGAGLGLDRGDVSWGDMDGDGYFDIVAMGMNAANARELRIYLSTGNGAGFVLDQSLTGLSHGNLDLGDYDGDGDLDVIASGNDGATRQLRVHVNNSTLGNINLAAGVAVQTGNGFDYTATIGSGCGLKWADMNSDGDLDVVVCGQDNLSGLPQLYLYFNQGNGTFAAPIDVTPAGSPEFYQWGDLVVADFDGDGKMDIAAQGFDEAGVVVGDMRTAVYRGNGAGAFTATIFANGVGSGGLDAGDYNSDGRPDLLVSGYHGVGGNGRDIRVYPNTSTPGAVSFGAVVMLENTTGLNRGEAAWGDYNNDGRLDAVILGAVDGTAGTQAEIRLSSGTVGGFAADIPMDGTAGLVNEGSVAWGDFDQDGDADMVVSGRTEVGTGGTPELRVYRNHWASTPGGVNNPPTASASVATDFVFSPVGTSTASFKWSPATDDITAVAALRYQVQAATTTPAYTAPLAINTPSPQSFPMIYDGNTRHGTVLISTNPWDPQSGTLTGLVTDTTYYFRVKTIDGGSLESGWSADGFLWTGVVPGSSTIAAASGVPGQSSVTWSSPGDDLFRGNLTTGSSYRLQYSTSASTAWSTGSTPAGAFTVPISTNNQVPGTAQTVVLSGLTEGTSYYFRLWTQDDVGQWSTISNQTTAYIMIGTRDLVLSTGAYNFGTVGLTLSTQTTTMVSVTLAGNVNSTYRLYAATTTAGSPWSLAAAPGPDQLRLYAAFNATQPAFAAFGAEDVVLSGSQTCTATVFALGQNCLNLPVGTVRNLWFRLDMPTISSDATAQEQRIQVTVEAGPP